MSDCVGLYLLHLISLCVFDHFQTLHIWATLDPGPAAPARPGSLSLSWAQRERVVQAWLVVMQHNYKPTLFFGRAKFQWTGRGVLSLSLLAALFLINNKPVATLLLLPFSPGWAEEDGDNEIIIFEESQTVSSLSFLNFRRVFLLASKLGSSLSKKIRHFLWIKVQTQDFILILRS